MGDKRSGESDGTQLVSGAAILDEAECLVLVQVVSGFAQSHGIDIEIAIVRMLLAEVITGMHRGVAPGQDLLQLLDRILQVIGGKFSAGPQHQRYYLAHGGGSLENLGGCLKGGSGKKHSTVFFIPGSSTIPQSCSAYQACKIHRSAAQSRGSKQKYRFPSAVQQIIGSRKEMF